MILDIIGVILIIIFFVRGYMKGIVVAAFSLLGIILGIILALKLSHLLGEWMYKKGIITSGWGQILSYVIIFILVVIIVRLIAKAIETAMQAVLLGWLNKLIGGMLYAFMIVFIWSSLLWIGEHIHIISKETIAASKTYKYFAPVAPWVCDKVGIMIPFVKNIFTELQGFFDMIDHKLPEHVGAA